KMQSADSCSSESEVEIITMESGDSDLEEDESEFCSGYGGLYLDEKGPKCDWLQW
ncbi:hypothetical protein HHI36_008852, partial [Cryptolaemus montrouzieri]